MEKKYTKINFNIDMNNGFVKFGAMSNQEYLKLVPEQLKVIKKFRDENELVAFVLEWHNEDALEFKTYPDHCIANTPEAELIDELKEEQDKENTETYHKNCTNGMLNRTLQDRIKELKELKEVVITGVCEDICVMDFARTLAKFLDEINKEVKIFVVRNAVDTFDAPFHNREEWKTIAEKVMTAAGITYVDNVDELNEKEKVLSL